jgi:hypothetical protein
MGTYKATGKLSAGVYDSQFFDKEAPLSADRFAKDWTASARYDISPSIYLKADEHYINGSALSLDSLRNPNPEPWYWLTAMKIGVVF